ncbi:hypothetical protein PVAG01_09943 [Phlyctema vagabunda]|uniref:DUF6604 domain-containing protein n=1 Tax=Phlyctema vagabunda TaxID=108571 RepID=A0ABR4P4K1_9HELO
MIHASNSIIKSSHAIPTTGIAPTVNTTGQIKVSAFVPISELIAKHISPIPSTIFRLFQSVIEARTATHAVFQQIVTEKPVAEIERSNISHKCFIDSLTQAFQILGGGRGRETRTLKQKSETENLTEENIDEVIFANQFSTLNLKESDNEEGAGNSADEEPEINIASASSVRPKKTTKGKGKKGKRGKKGKGKSKPAPKEASLDDIPLESCRIIEDESGIITDYLMAVYSIVKK